MNDNYEDLANAAQRGELRRKPGTRLTGDAAAREAQNAVLAAAAVPTLGEAFAQLTTGRPRAGAAKRGPSRQFRVRASDEMYEAVEDLAAREGLGVSEVVRQAIAEHLARQTA